MRYCCPLLLTVFLIPLPLSCAAQNPAPADGPAVVHVGKGSYAASPPPGAGSTSIETQKLYLVKDDGHPIPSNKWWTQLVVSQFARSLWAFPLKVDTSERGMDLFFPTRWGADGRDPVSEFPLGVGGADFRPADARAKDWSDWTVSFRMAESPQKFMDVTLGEGMPFTWIQFHGLQPVLRLPGPGARFFGRTDQNQTLPASQDCLGIQFNGRQFGVFAPDETKFQTDGANVDVTFAGPQQYLVISPLPSPGDMDLFHQYAYAMPTDTRLSWQYDPAGAQVITTWTISTQPLKGTERRVLQEWLPHHYDRTVNDLKLTGVNYLSPRGTLKCAVGNQFTIRYPYTGILPNLPAPHALGGVHADYDPQRMHTYLSDVAARPQFGGDTYWGGKDILRFGQCALMAQQTHDPAYDAFVSNLRSAMEDWYTYAPGKQQHYFMYYPHWRSLVGVKTSYGSEGFNDHHFHYGYFTFATALLAMHDARFAADYGPMATLVAKDYANWDRADQRFPFFRTFDIWAGHSWAGGTSSPGGENQESSSEAVQSWAGLIYLGQALGDTRMRDAGIMGYAMETQAAMDYWFNATGDVFPPEWKHHANGMVWSGGELFGTYFTGDPAWVYAIQWLPTSPMLEYLARDPAFARKMYQNMTEDYETQEEEDAATTPPPGQQPHAARQPTIKTFGAGLGNVMLGYVLMYDPKWSCEQLDELWNEPGDDIAHNADEMAVIYYQAHSMRDLGLVDWSCHGSSPTSMVFKDVTNQRTYVVWNPSIHPETVTFYNADKPIGQLIAAPQALTRSRSLQVAG